MEGGLCIWEALSGRKATLCGARPGSLTLDFYPRLPRGGRPRGGGAGTAAQGISIHALREEGDYCTSCNTAVELISIHALREEGDIRLGRLGRLLPISIHALREEGDLGVALQRVGLAISIHALREEGD